MSTCTGLRAGRGGAGMQRHPRPPPFHPKPGAGGWAAHEQGPRSTANASAPPAAGPHHRTHTAQAHRPPPARAAGASSSSHGRHRERATRRAAGAFPPQCRRRSRGCGPTIRIGPPIMTQLTSNGGGSQGGRSREGSTGGDTHVRHLRGAAWRCAELGREPTVLRCTGRCQPHSLFLCCRHWPGALSHRGGVCLMGSMKGGVGCLQVVAVGSWQSQGGLRAVRAAHAAQLRGHRLPALQGRAARGAAPCSHRAPVGIIAGVQVILFLVTPAQAHACP